MISSVVWTASAKPQAGHAADGGVAQLPQRAGGGGEDVFEAGARGVPVRGELVLAFRPDLSGRGVVRFVRMMIR